MFHNLLKFQLGPRLAYGSSHTYSNLREGRRFRALELKQAGWSQREIAEALGVTEGAVSRWMKAVQAQGLRGLAAHLHPGAPPQARSGGAPAVAGAVGPRGGRTGIPWGSLDLRSRRPPHRAGVRGSLSQGACVACAQGVEMDPPGAAPTGHPAGRGGDSALAHRTVAALKKGALRKGQMPVVY